MNTGQLLITVGAIMLLTLVILRINDTFLNSDSILRRSKFGILSVSLATSIIEEASNKAFDEVTLSGRILSSDELTASSSFGPDTTPDSVESYAEFDDFDDFDGYIINTKDDSTFLSVEFTGWCTVEYVDPEDPDSSLSGADKSFHKKITVYVTSESMYNFYTETYDTLEMSSVFSYWFF